MITVFYDGKCSLCSAEINYYKKISSKLIFNWEDISQSKDKLDLLGVSSIDALKLMHVVDHQGKIHIGVDAFILMWQNMSQWTFVAKIASLPVFYNIAVLLYRVFAKWRFNRSSNCKI